MSRAAPLHGEYPQTPASVPLLVSLRADVCVCVCV